MYARSLAVPDGLSGSAAARDSLDQALLIANDVPADLGAALARLARTAFDAGYAAVLATATALLLATAAFVLFNRWRMRT
ncbi:hypothetical protein D9M69_529530 [compost metagenome]